MNRAKFVLAFLCCTVNSSAQDTSVVRVGCSAGAVVNYYNLSALEENPVLLDAVNSLQIAPQFGIVIGKKNKFGLGLTTSYITRTKNGSYSIYQDLKVAMSVWSIAFHAEMYPLKCKNILVSTTFENVMMVLKSGERSAPYSSYENAIIKQFPVLGFNCGYRFEIQNGKRSQYSTVAKVGYNFSFGSANWYSGNSKLTGKPKISFGGPTLTLIFEGWISN